jgi:hypothetical protein
MGVSMEDLSHFHPHPHHHHHPLSKFAMTTSTMTGTALWIARTMMDVGLMAWWVILQM